jgi:hypothetical protein
VKEFWLATQFAKGQPKRKKKNKDKSGVWTKPRKAYNWLTGARK